jgi:hypothetical protein
MDRHGMNSTIATVNIVLTSPIVATAATSAVKLFLPSLFKFIHIMFFVIP